MFLSTIEFLYVYSVKGLLVCLCSKESLCPLKTEKLSSVLNSFFVYNLLTDSLSVPYKVFLSSKDEYALVLFQSVSLFVFYRRINTCFSSKEFVCYQ